MDIPRDSHRISSRCPSLSHTPQGDPLKLVSKNTCYEPLYISKLSAALDSEVGWAKPVRRNWWGQNLCGGAHPPSRYSWEKGGSPLLLFVGLRPLNFRFQGGMGRTCPTTSRARGEELEMQNTHSVVLKKLAFKLSEITYPGIAWAAKATSRVFPKV